MGRVSEVGAHYPISQSLKPMMLFWSGRDVPAVHERPGARQPLHGDIRLEGQHRAGNFAI